MGQNVIERIAQRHATGLSAKHTVRSGDFVGIRPAHVMTHDNTSAVLKKFESLLESLPEPRLIQRVHDPAQLVFGLDHDVQDTSESNLAKYARIEAFARAQGIAFYPAGRGIVHQILCEEGFVLPGSLVVGSDSHSNIYGALGALGTPVVRTDAAALWATGETWWQVPPVALVELEGVLPPGVSGKDVVLALIGHFNKDEVLNHAVVFAGDGVAALTMEQRLTIANMTTEWGALAGVFPYDETTHRYLQERAAVQRARAQAGGTGPGNLSAEVLASLPKRAVTADLDASYAHHLSLDLGSVSPYVAGPDEVQITTPIADMEKRDVRIHKAYLLSCVNGRVGDFAEAAAVLRGRKIHEGVQLYVAAASSEVEAESRRRGDWQVILAAGAIPLPAGCGPCIGLGKGVLEAGEVAISATNRNFKGRMGSRDAETYLASPAVVAASAVAGRIIGPSALEGRASPPAVALRAAVIARGKGHAPAPVTILEGFPATIEDELLFVDQDNLNTDGIYGKDVTYRDDLTPAEMGRHAFLNYDPDFQKLARDGDLLVGGFAFGTGSSREQAATALLNRGIRLVIAGSFSDTYKRNAFNNGFMCVDCPELVTMLRQRFRERVPTRRTALVARLDFTSSLLSVEGQTFSFIPLGQAAQELILAGGLETLVRRRLQR
ncbi:MAG: homoaconitase [Planctomycetota bacterium]